MMQSRPNQKIQHSRLVELLAAGLSAKQCAEQFNCTYAAVTNYIRRHRLASNCRPYQKLTAEQKKDIIKMVSNGVPVHYVARLYKKNYATLLSLLFHWKVKSRWLVQGARKDGSYGLPVSNDEIVDNWNTVFAWLRKRYRHLTVDELTDAVNQSSLELRRMPRPERWFAFWLTIATSRAVDTVRLKAAEMRAARGQRVEYDDVIRVEAGVDFDMREELQVAISRLPKHLQKVIHAKLADQSEPWIKLGMSQSRYYACLQQAYDVLREII